MKKGYGIMNVSGMKSQVFVEQADLEKLIRQNKDLKKIMPFYKILTDKMTMQSDGVSMPKWKKAFPNFYAWLMDNGFRYDATKDKTIRRTVSKRKE